jgi:hypothetical protein
MKKIVGLLVIFTTISACERTTDLQPDLDKTVPQAVVNSLKEVFPEATDVTFSTIEKNKVWGARFETDAAYSVALDSDGTFYNIYKKISEQQLPSSARAHIQPGSVMKEAYQQLTTAHTANGFVAVTWSQKDSLVTYLFTQEGQMQEALTTANKTGQAEVPYISYYLAENELPDYVKTYLAANYAGWTFGKGVAEIINGSRTTYVYLTKDGQEVHKIFDADGNATDYKPAEVIVDQGPSDVLLLESDLPQSVKDFLNKDYTGWSYKKGVISGATDQITFLITVGTDSYEFLFSRNWTFISVQKL